jgi:hypothetical protein
VFAKESRRAGKTPARNWGNGSGGFAFPPPYKLTKKLFSCFFIYILITWLDLTKNYLEKHTKRSKLRKNCFCSWLIFFHVW